MFFERMSAMGAGFGFWADLFFAGWALFHGADYRSFAESRQIILPIVGVEVIFRSTIGGGGKDRVSFRALLDRGGLVGAGRRSALV